MISLNALKKLPLGTQGKLKTTTFLPNQNITDVEHEYLIALYAIQDNILLYEKNTVLYPIHAIIDYEHCLVGSQFQEKRLGLRFKTLFLNRITENKLVLDFNLPKLTHKEMNI